MAPPPTRLSAARTAALDATLARLDAFADAPIALVPGTAMVVLDADLRIRLMLGPEWEEIGVDVAALTGRLLTDVARPASLDRVLPHCAAALRGETRQFDLPFRSGRVHWVTVQPIRGDRAVEGILAVSWDQTESLHTEALYRVLAQNATDVVTRHDRTGRLVYVSPFVTALTGWTPEELLGRSCFELMHPDDVERALPELTAATASRELVTIEARFRRKDGSYVWLEGTARTVPGADGSHEYQCASRDITQRRRTQEELARRLAQQSAVARLGELALRRLDIDSLLDEAARLVAGTLDVALVSVFEHIEGPRMLLRGGHGWPDGMTGSEIEVSSFGGEKPGRHYADGAVVIDDLPTDASMRARPLRANGVISSASVLIGDRDHPVGLLGAHSTTRRRFGPEDLDFLHAVAHVIAGALERVATEERIRHDALHDALTGLPNRTLLLDRMRIAQARAERDGTRVGLLFLDLDRLKVLNDSLGHHAGDELLRGVGPRLAGVLRPADTVARFGGDEFAVLLEGLGDEREALAVAGRIVAAFEQPFTIGGEPRFGTASVGVVVTDPALPRDATELLSDADAALYRAKERGRARYEVFDAGLRDRITSRLLMEQDLRRALDGEGRLWIAYQPIWRLADRRVAGIEALVRWDHPARGAIAPDEFIPVAEESGMIVELGARVLRDACRHVARLRAETPATALALTVNLSARQVAAPSIVDTVAGALRDSGLPAKALGLEITEGLLLEETPATVQTIVALQELGVRLILDDFGTGYSSLRYLQRYPLDGLKIDRSFVAGLGADGDGDGAIVAAIVGMARALGMGVIPEGVETAGQLARLTALGCEYAQGYHLAHPLDPDALEARLRAGGRPDA